MVRKGRSFAQMLPSQNEVKEFLIVFQSLPCLHNKQCADYHNEDVKLDARRSLGQRWGMTDNEVKFAIKTCRSYFSGAKNHRDSQMVSGAGRVDPFKGKAKQRWWWDHGKWLLMFGSNLATQSSMGDVSTPQESIGLTQATPPTPSPSTSASAVPSMADVRAALVKSEDTNHGFMMWAARGATALPPQEQYRFHR